MDMMIRLRKARRLAWLLVSAIGVPYLSVAAVAAPKIAPAAPKSVVVFPMYNANSDTSAQVSDDLNTLLRDALSTDPGYKVVVYSERLPAVQRLVAMQPDKKSLTAGPFTSDAAGVERAIALGKTMSADLLIVGTVEKYTFNDTAGTADVTVNTKLVDGTTGKLVQSLTVTGRGIGKTTRMEGVSEVAVQRDAAKDAVRKIMRAVTGVEYKEPVQSQVVVEKKKKKSWLPMVLLSLGVGLLLGGSSGSGGGTADTGGTDNPPPPPL